MDLGEVVDTVRNYPGVVRKGPIRDIFSRLVLDGQQGRQLPNFGDDAAVIPWRNGLLLLAADGIMTKLLINEPYAAGKSSVMVTVNDIYSMGGRPLAMVNVLASGNDKHRAEVIEGIRKGCEKLKVPMVGGHLHPDAPDDAPSLSVAILGWAKKVLHSHQAKDGDALVFAADLKGRRGCSSVVSWDANSEKTPDELLFRLEALPIISENEWANAAKDVSNAGILGTISIMMENSGKGAAIDLDKLPCPEELSLSDWLICFQSFGFILSVPPQHVDTVVGIFTGRGIDAAIVGKVIQERKVFINRGTETKVLFDFEQDRNTGIMYDGK